MEVFTSSSPKRDCSASAQHGGAEERIRALSELKRKRALIAEHSAPTNKHKKKEAYYESINTGDVADERVGVPVVPASQE
ncbi:hypothetical protein P3T76_006621 [Phytophthora citrophthora]|uniref:Uncharacterized protein n=1 Tax=Phytophthora citrophthora TaxID=4793 RepID=A0AAD9GNZ9_9STRA|nr:hypothetical protein P3T76_006621 [Phytophthora citrophthora]